MHFAIDDHFLLSRKWIKEVVFMWKFQQYLYNKQNITWPLRCAHSWEILSAREDKNRIPKRPCNILYIHWKIQLILITQWFIRCRALFTLWATKPWRGMKKQFIKWDVRPGARFYCKTVEKILVWGPYAMAQAAPEKAVGPARIARLFAWCELKQLCCYINPDFSVKMSDVSEYSDRDFTTRKKKDNTKIRKIAVVIW